MDPSKVVTPPTNTPHVNTPELTKEELQEVLAEEKEQRQ
jgi:hypothetical protein